MNNLGVNRMVMGAAVTVLMAVTPALAQSSQSTGTSGPAAGSNVQPSAAAQKKNDGDTSSGATSAGAPGTAAKKGSESGPAPDQKPPHQR